MAAIRADKLSLLRRKSVPQIHRSFLVRRDGFYAVAALGVAALSILLYEAVRPNGPPNGGSFTGYFLGTAGLGLIAWLAWFGIRKKRYGEAGSLAEWLSAHVYLGLALIVVATLHAAFRFHGNIHTLAYLLMVGVIVSGVFGAYAYWRYPALMSANRKGATLADLAAELAALDLRCRELASALDPETARIVAAATDADLRPMSWRDALFGEGKNPLGDAAAEALVRLRDSVGGAGRATPAAALPLVESLTRRAALMVRIRRDWRYRTLMLMWRAVHVPLTIALLVALIIHVVAVFYYW